MLVCIAKSAASSEIYSKVLQLKHQSVHHARMIALATAYIYFVTCYTLIHKAVNSLLSQ